MIDYQAAKKIAGVLAAVGEPTRLQVLYRLADGPHYVGQLADVLGVPMVNLSHHLGVLRQAGLIEDDKDGRRVVYSFRPGVYSRGGAPDVIGSLTVGACKLVLVRPPGSTAGVVKKGRRKERGDGG